MDRKEHLMKNLIDKLSKEEKITNIYARRKGIIKNVGLVNQFGKHEFIPNKWFDWTRRVNAEIMIIGQDWGPYSALTKFVQDYDNEQLLPNFNYDEFLFKTFSSRTEKFIISTLENSYYEHYNKKIDKVIWDNFFFTIAVLFTRQGNNFRGNDNFEPLTSLNLSYPYLTEQIKIVSPKVIIPLGNMAWEVLARYYSLASFGKNITEVVNKSLPKGIIKLDNVTIIPNFHPASHVDPKIIFSQFAKVWEVMG
jgi:hypothetical protein